MKGYKTQGYKSPKDMTDDEKKIIRYQNDIRLF